MGLTQREKGERFRRLHEGACFVIPNPWDVGSAKVLTGMGFAALATSSAAAAASIGKRDGALTREEALAHARTIVEATNSPAPGDQKPVANEPKLETPPAADEESKKKFTKKY